MPEILAPAGDEISLKAAIASGADAVYLGLSVFNARMRAGNFTVENLKSAVEYCHIFGVRVYVTVNTLIKNSEMDELSKAIVACDRANVDALIIADFAVLEIAQRLAPNLPLHASTQLGICNAAAARYAEELGFTRVVLSREVTLNEIIEIKKSTKLEIECFVHGALCVAFSGKCLFSSTVNGNSGNRGRCLQPCRLKYTEEMSGKSGYLLSSADLCLANKLKQLSDAGVSSFKIEGRLRRPEYVYNTVKTYRKIVNQGFTVKKEDLITLESAFNRGGFTEGYAFGDNKIVFDAAQGNAGRILGKITEINGGFIKISGGELPKTPFGYKLFDDNGRELSGGMVKTFSVDGRPKIPDARVGSLLSVTSRPDFTFDEKKVEVSISYTMRDGILTATAEGRGCTATVSNKIPFEAAKKQPLTIADINAAFSKNNEEEFKTIKVDGTIKGSCFAPRATLNEIRRNAIAELRKEILKKYDYTKISGKNRLSIINNPLNESGLIAVELQNIAQLTSRLLSLADIIIYSPRTYSVASARDFVKQAGNAKVYLKLPANAREDDILLFKSIFTSVAFTGIYADNLYAIRLANEFGLKLFAGLGLNIINKKVLEYLPFTHYLASPELNYRELQEFDNPFVYAYGYLPLMHLSHDVAKVIGGVQRDNYTYVDRAGFKFNVEKIKARHCYYVLYNSKITDISAKFTNNRFNYYLNMLQCDGEKVANICATFKDGRSVATVDPTYLHMQRGVK